MNGPAEGCPMRSLLTQGNLRPWKWRSNDTRDLSRLLRAHRGRVGCAPGVIHVATDITEKKKAKRSCWRER
jgi:hypothetical protein